MSVLLVLLIACFCLGIGGSSCFPVGRMSADSFTVCTRVFGMGGVDVVLCHLIVELVSFLTWSTNNALFVQICQHLGLRPDWDRRSDFSSARRAMCIGQRLSHTVHIVLLNQRLPARTTTGGRWPCRRNCIAEAARES